MDETVTIEYPVPEYSLFTTSRDGLPAIVVVNAALKDFPHRDIFPWFVSILIDAVELANQGMPTHDEQLVLDRVGDELEVALLESRNAIFLARSTCNGIRQLILYANNGEMANDVLAEFVSRPDQERQWEYRIEVDVEWKFAEPYLRMFDDPQ